ncbi:carboxypeptidase-like regulatory domain-containing protein [Winogradskyella tangerina]|uniref:carboxypeptidase-like regulatory domain-containing protein n=1 Tax=Winogradskyella tangerina TaxID=2023240 RepID=UPI000DBE2C0F|nr:carboxypeptidase-like regulatory domain-containing protein [Winogradskyella tangerina]
MKLLFSLLVLFFTTQIFSQITIKGQVFSDSIPLESASVYIKHTTSGMATDINGDFTLNAKQGDTLAVSYLGYKTKEVIVTDGNDLNIELITDSFDEVEIVGYLVAVNKESIFRCFGSTREVKPILEREFDNTEDGNRLILYPNPSSNGIFKLKLYEDYDAIKISVVNISGQIINKFTYQKFGEDLTIDLSQCAQGFYIINIVADGEPLQAIKAIRG